MLGCTMLLRYDYLKAVSWDVAFNTPAGQVARPAASALATQNFGLYGGLVTLILGGFSVIAWIGRRRAVTDASKLEPESETALDLALQN